jgi:uncharacterized membrane protein YhaH (DUF805 family)
MKQCPRCRKNLVDSAVSCTFCHQPLPAAMAVAAASPYASRPAPSRAHPARFESEGEAPTLNPFVLFGRCFRPKGSFTRGQFAIVYLGAVAAFWSVAFLAPFTLGMLGASEDVILRGTTFAFMVMVPVVLMAAFGGSIRRWHDLGKPGYYVLLWIVPCVNGITVLYLLLAPGERGSESRGATSGWLVAAAVCVVGVFGVGLVSAIAIPSLLRARVSANESAAIADVRSVIAAEAAYQSANGGFYEGRLECLSSPAEGCLPRHLDDGSGFVEAALTAPGPRHGYESRLEAGAPAAVDPARSSPTSVVAFAYVLTPVQPGQTGVRSFCGDSTGLVCYRPDGADIATAGAACPRSPEVCRPIS